MNFQWDISNQLEYKNFPLESLRSYGKLIFPWENKVNWNLNCPVGNCHIPRAFLATIVFAELNLNVFYLYSFTKSHISLFIIQIFIIVISILNIDISII